MRESVRDRDRVRLQDISNQSMNKTCRMEREWETAQEDSPLANLLIFLCCFAVAPSTNIISSATVPQQWL